MFRLVVLSALVAVVTAAPAPGYLHVVPVATSHQERVDIIESHPVVKTILTPVVQVISHDHNDDIDDVHDIHNIDEYYDDDSPIYEDDDDIHESYPVETVLISQPIVHAEEDIHSIPLVSSVQSVESHQELHQVHDTPIVHSLEPVVEDIHVETLPVVDVHQVSPIVSSVDSVSHQEVHQVHNAPVVLHSVEVPQVVSHELPVVVSHEEVPHVQVVPLVQTVQVPVVVGHGDVHQEIVEVDGGHEW